MVLNKTLKANPLEACRMVLNTVPNNSSRICTMERVAHWIIVQLGNATTAGDTRYGEANELLHALRKHIDETLNGK